LDSVRRVSQLAGRGAVQQKADWSGRLTEWRRECRPSNNKQNEDDDNGGDEKK
jgi:hypothetical protein